MDPKRITDEYAVNAQVLPSEMEAVAALGYVTVINNRPEGEEPGQPSEAEIRAAAEAAGLSYHFIPMAMPSLSPETVERQEAAIAGSDGPVLAFCRSGTRSSILWALSQVCFHGKPISEAIDAAAEQGYDLSQVEPLLEQYRNVLRP